MKHGTLKTEGTLKIVILVQQQKVYSAIHKYKFACVYASTGSLTLFIHPQCAFTCFEHFFLSVFYFMSVHSKVILGNRMHQHLHVHYAPKALAATPLSGHMTILYTLVGMGSAVLAAAVALPC